MRALALISALVSFLLFSSLAFALKPIWAFPRTIDTVEYLAGGDSAHKFGVEAGVWFATVANKTYLRYLVWRFSTKYDIKLYRFDESLTKELEVTHPGKTAFLKTTEPYIGASPELMLYTFLDTGNRFIARLVNVTNLGIVYEANPINFTRQEWISISNWIPTFDVISFGFFGAVSGSQIVAVDSNWTLYYDWFVDGNLTDKIKTYSLPSPVESYKPYILYTERYCHVFAEENCLFSILYWGRPTVNDPYSFYVREFRVTEILPGVFQLQYRDFRLPEMPAYTEPKNVDFFVYFYRDPFKTRSFIIFDRIWTDGKIYDRSVYDIEFKFYEWYAISDYISRSPMFTAPKARILANHVPTVIADYTNVTLPDWDSIYFTFYIKSIQIFYANYPNVDINISNATYFEVERVRFPFQGADYFYSLPLNISSFKNQSVSINFTLSFFGWAEIGDLYLGFPKEMSFSYVPNIKLGYIPGAEIGFFAVPTVWGGAPTYPDYCDTRKCTVKYFYQDIEWACECTPWTKDICINTTHRRFTRDCSPIDCAPTTKLEEDSECAYVPPVPPPTCGNGICDVSETYLNCPQDCPPPPPTIPILNVTGYCAMANITDPGLLALCSTLETLTLPIVFMTFLLVAVSGYVGMKAGAQVGIVTAMVLMFIFAFVGIYPVWLTILLTLAVGFLLWYFITKVVR